MKSPFTGKEMKRVYEKRTWNFRGEPFEYVHQSLHKAKLVQKGSVQNIV